MTSREQMTLRIKHLSESIAAGMAWDKAQGQKVYAYSGQCRSDRANLRATRRKLAELDRGTSAVRFVPALPLA